MENLYKSIGQIFPWYVFKLAIFTSKKRMY